MQTTYFTTFLLGETASNTPASFKAVTPFVEHWLFKNRRNVKCPDGFSFDEDSDHEVGDDAFVRVRCVDGDDGEVSVCAVRLEHPDSSPGTKRRWYSDCVLVRDPSSETLRMSVCVGVGSPADHYTPMRTPFSRPKIVPEIIKRLGAREYYPMKSVPIPIKDDEIDAYYRWLVEAERRLPIVFVSVDSDTGEALIDTDILANQLAGAAHVCVAESNEVTWLLRDKMSNVLNAYNGAVRIYWPGFSASTNPYQYRRWLPAEIETSGSPKAKRGDKTIGEICEKIMDVAVLRHLTVPSRWEDVQRIRAQHLMHSLKNAGKDGEAWDMAEVLVAEVEKDKTELAGQLDETNNQIKQLNAEIAALRDDNRNWESLVHGFAESDGYDARDYAVQRHTPKSVTEALEIIGREYEDRIFIVTGRIKGEADYFDAVDDAFRALQWLVTTYWESKTGQQQVDDLEGSCKEMSTFFFSANQSSSSMGLRPKDYEFRVGKNIYTAESHIGKGSSPDPRRSLRIGFAFDSDEKKIYVGYVGQHQKSKRTN